MSLPKSSTCDICREPATVKVGTMWVCQSREEWMKTPPSDTPPHEQDAITERTMDAQLDAPNTPSGTG